MANISIRMKIRESRRIREEKNGGSTKRKGKQDKDDDKKE
jgi:hypothetical protein